MEVRFQANQVTKDNVDIRIRGMVLYRIDDPIRIYKLINFTNRPTAEIKLAHVISDLCRSTTKWLVANMNVEECLRRRKEEIALALKSEVARVVSGSTESSWGVEIITIDILDVYIQDEELFESLQARFKVETRREAELAVLAADEAVERRTIERDEMLATERHRLQMQADALELERERKRVEGKRHLDAETFALDRYRVEETKRSPILRQHRSWHGGSQKPRMSKNFRATVRDPSGVALGLTYGLVRSETRSARADRVIDAFHLEIPFDSGFHGHFCCAPRSRVMIPWKLQGADSVFWVMKCLQQTKMQNAIMLPLSNFEGI